MRRLARYTLNALTVLSLLLCVATPLAIRPDVRLETYKPYKGHWDLLVLGHRFRDVGQWVSIAVPAAIIAVLAMPMVGVIVRLVLRYARSSHAAARTAAGSCTHCNYDLRATPDRCPECGAPAKGAM